MRIFTNANIYTFSSDSRNVEAIAENDGIIRGVGSLESMQELMPAARIVDLGGGTLLPAFTDAHLHLISLGMSLTELSLNEKPLQEVLNLVQKACAEQPPGRWVTGRGFNFNDWVEGWPQQEWLDKVSPNHPVVLTAKDGHMIWANSLACAAAGVTPTMPTPAGGEIGRDHLGGLTGVFKERAVELITSKIPPPSREQLADATQRAIRLLNSLGITAVHNMEDAPAWRTLQFLQRRGSLNLRVLMSVPADQLDNAVGLGLSSGFGDERLSVGAVKVFADGSLGSRTAWMLAPYEQDKHCGVVVTPEHELGDIVRKANQAGFPVAVHAIGDGANRAILNAIERYGDPCRRNRIEHAQLVDPKDIERFARLNVIASMQPTQCPQDREMAEEHWGQRRSSYAYPFRSLLRSGAALAFGSDAPVEHPSVLTGIYSAVTRRLPCAKDGAWNESETLTIEEAVCAYTVGAAYAAGQENRRGRIAPGFQADFVLLARDIMAEKDPAALMETPVLATYLGGDCVFAL